MTKKGANRAVVAASATLPSDRSRAPGRSDLPECATAEDFVEKTARIGDRARTAAPNAIEYPGASREVWTSDEPGPEVALRGCHATAGKTGRRAATQRLSPIAAHNALAEEGLIQWLCLAVDGQHRPVWPGQNERAIFHDDVLGVKARGRQARNRPRMVGARVIAAARSGHIPKWNSRDRCAPTGFSPLAKFT